MSKVTTTWECKTYEVWGNEEDGWEVNDISSTWKEEIDLSRISYNAGTDRQFYGAHPTDEQIKNAFGIDGDIETDGDDLNIYVNDADDGYPIGEMHCTSHSSLSPVRK